MPDTHIAPPLWFDPTLCLIGGRWQAPIGGETLSLINPSDGTALALSLLHI